jgi:hypothetical protein
MASTILCLNLKNDIKDDDENESFAVVLWLRSLFAVFFVDLLTGESIGGEALTGCPRIEIM